MAHARLYKHYPKDRSEDGDYVRSWLEQIRTSSTNDGHLTSDKGGEDTGSPPWRPYNLPISNKENLIAGVQYERLASRKPRDSPIRSPSLYSPEDRRVISTSPASAHHDGYDVEPDHQDSCSNSLKNVYEKRPRRKTRPEKYETKRRKVEAETPRKKRPSKLASKRKQKPTLRSGKEVMHNFVSESIPAERVTVCCNNAIATPG